MPRRYYRTTDLGNGWKMRESFTSSELASARIMYLLLLPIRITYMLIKWSMYFMLVWPFKMCWKLVTFSYKKAVSINKLIPKLLAITVLTLVWLVLFSLVIIRLMNAK